MSSKPGKSANKQVRFLTNEIALKRSILNANFISYVRLHDKFRETTHENVVLASWLVDFKFSNCMYDYERIAYGITDKMNDIVKDSYIRWK